MVAYTEKYMKNKKAESYQEIILLFRCIPYTSFKINRWLISIIQNKS